MICHPNNGYLSAFVQKMKKENLDPVVINTFTFYYSQVLSGETGMICEKDIKPIDPKELPHINDLTSFAEAGKQARKLAVIIVLNGGLGTSMGLKSAKSLIKAKAGKSFLDIILAQAESQDVTVCFMNSFNTHHDTLAYLKSMNPSIPIMYFIQNKFPKILQNNLAPANWSQNPLLEWNPPGHGDIYTALYTSGTLDKLLSNNIKYAFISNSDNRGGILDDSLLGYFVENKIPFMMEISQRGPLDMKGGHLARQQPGRLILREIMQCPQEDLNTFQDINLHRFFNTNNIWLNLENLRELIERDGLIRLPIILNSKTLDPRDETSPAVYQIETAMGSAISVFEGATAVIVAKNRFFPVKTCNGLLVLRSDRIILTENNKLLNNPENKVDGLEVKLDPRFYGKIDLFEQRFPDGVPSLVNCRSLKIEGDVCFRENITITGHVTIKNKGVSQAEIKAGTVVDSDLFFELQ